MSTTNRPSIKWLAVAIPICGVALCVAAVVRGEPWLGVAYLAITFGFAATLVIFPRFRDTVALLSDDKYEERNVHLHQRAAFYTLNILALLFVGHTVYETFWGGGVGMYGPVAIVGAVTYFTCLLVMNWRS